MQRVERALAFLHILLAFLVQTVTTMHALLPPAFKLDVTLPCSVFLSFTKLEYLETAH